MSTSQDLEDVLPGSEPRQPWPRAVRGWLRAAFIDNLALKFVAFVLALTVFILVHSDEEATLRTTVRVSYSALDDRVLVSEPVDRVQLRVRGSRRRIKRLSDSDIENIHVNLQNLSNGRYEFTEDMFDLPEGLEIVGIEPEGLNLEFDERVEKTAQVVVDYAGAPARGHKIAAVSPTPSEVTVAGAARRLQALESVKTQELNLQGRSASFREAVPLVADGFEFVGTDVVTVDVTLVEELEARRLADRKVEIQPGPGLTADVTRRYQVRPEKVQVELFGSFNAVQAIDADKIQVFVVLEPDDLEHPRERRVEVAIEPKLPGVAYKITPSDVTLAPR